MIHVQVRPTYRNRVDPALIQQYAQTVLEQEIRDGNATILITGNREIQSYNLSYRNLDSPTDVLSFADGSPDPETGEDYLGDILISWMKANKQAKQENHSLDAELALLTVHGMLHLLGYDHHQTADRKRMWQRQSEILSVLGFDISGFDALEKVQE